MTPTLTFEYTSVHGPLAAAYTCGALAAEFGPEQVRVCWAPDAEERGDAAPLLAELAFAEAQRYRHDTRLLGVVDDGDSPAWALVTSHVTLERHPHLLVRALSAVVQARPHRRPSLTGLGEQYQSWIADCPLRAAQILLIEDFAGAGLSLAA